MRYKRGEEKERWEGATERAIGWGKRVESDRRMSSVEGSDRHDGWER